MSAAVSLAFFDSAHGRYGITRSAATLLFEGSSATVLDGGPALEARDTGWRATLDDRLELDFERLGEPVELGGVKGSVCRVTGTVDGTAIECLGTAGETAAPPAWDELDAVRSVSALFDDQHALLALARRPRGALGHGDELTVAWLLQDGEALGVEDARISTVYDADGRQRSAGLELWLPGEEFPRRGSGTVVAGTSLELEGLNVHAAVFRWRMEEREGLGAYELMVRDEPPAVARVTPSAVISDFGGVLTNPLIEAFTAYQEHSGIRMEDMGRALQSAAERDGEHPLFVLERGEISEAEFRHRLERELGDGVRLTGFREIYFEHLRPNRPMIDFMAALRGRGLRMALLTNNVREWEPLWRAKLPELDDVFEIVVDSAFVGMRKPEPEIYELTLERLGGGLSGSDCVFVDDLEPNCETARSLGMTAVLHRSAEQTISEIDAILG